MICCNNLSLRERVELAVEESFYRFCYADNDLDSPKKEKRFNDARIALRTEMRYSEAMNVIGELYQTIKSYFEFVKGGEK